MALSVVTRIELHAVSVFKLIMTMRSLACPKSSPHGTTVSTRLTCLELQQTASNLQIFRLMHRLRVEALALTLRESNIRVAKLLRSIVEVA